MFNQSLKEQIKPILFVLLLSAIGYLLNLTPVPLFANVYLILGNIAFVIVAMRFGVLYTLFAALIVTSSLIFSAGHPFGFLIFGLEAICIAFLRTRGWYVLYGDLFFWIFIGTPVTMVLLSTMADIPYQLKLLIMVKQVFNGLLCACIAGLLVYFFSKTFSFSFRQQATKVRGLKDQIVYATSLIVIFCIMSTSLFVTHKVLTYQHDTVESNLIDGKKHLVHRTNDFLNMYGLVVKNIANGLTLSPDINQQQQLTLISQQRNDYQYIDEILIAAADGTILVSNSNGNITADKLVKANDSIKSQANFKATITSKDGVIAKGMSNSAIAEPVILISYPYFTGSELKQVAGVVQISIKWLSLAKLMPEGMLQELHYVITDANNQIIYATPTVPVELNDHFKYQEKKDLSFKSTGLVTISTESGELKNDYFLSRGKLSNGWKIYVMLDSDNVISPVEREYLLLFALLILAVLISLGLAERIGIRLTKPLMFILKQIKSVEANNIHEFKPLRKTASIEISSLYDELQVSKKQILNHQQELENQVELRTQELELANQKLTKLAEKDALTKIYNRGYFDRQFSFFQKLAYRNKQTIAVIMIDLDNFKDINDLHGHLAGDNCLRKVAQIMTSEFCRETDVNARYGGEEFVILITGISPHNLDYKLERLRHRIEKSVIYTPDEKIIHISASIGAILAPATFSKDVLDWVEIADSCLYQAKKMGRNLVQIKDLTEQIDSQSEESQQKDSQIREQQAMDI
ncbi:diguanylate cyclase [Thalassomonas sp. M1454]|uniref:diguanylate cyclase n=1 Tax=Thalassomonas sp. M1454 TaxID=2594477 RepID=UPI00117E3FF1|nr:diguanylate cyclase [Thalassomonas sp. M1454]TRX54005.1 diguanylate cyclase [Thalassomonas sp. M1454]